VDREAVIVAHLVRLLRESPAVVWELLPGWAAVRPSDRPLHDPQGQIVAYARPAPTRASGH
jgi:hypothetical protein